MASWTTSWVRDKPSLEKIFEDEEQTMSLLLIFLYIRGQTKIYETKRRMVYGAL